jgi:hypothetical protein
VASPCVTPSTDAPQLDSARSAVKRIKLEVSNLRQTTKSELSSPILERPSTPSRAGPSRLPLRMAATHIHVRALCPLCAPDARS